MVIEYPWNKFKGGKFIYVTGLGLLLSFILSFGVIEMATSLVTSETHAVLGLILTLRGL